MEVLERAFDVKLDKMRKVADFCPSFYIELISEEYRKNKTQYPFKIRRVSDINGIKSGDILFMGFDKYLPAEHCGIALEVRGDLIDTVEWDTSYNFDINGGCLMKRIRHKGLIKAVVRVENS